jgi:RNA polymerase primary sigma factor
MQQLVLTNEIINRDAESLSRYFNEVKKIELLSPEKESLLALKVKQGDLRALQTLVESNLRFVISVAKRYQNRGVSITDLINEGNMGLIMAARRYDPTRGFKFISYAVWWIRQAIITAIAEQARLIHIPYNYFILMGRVKKSQALLEQELKRKATPEEIADHLQMKIKTLHRLMNFFEHEISLDHPADNNTEATLLDILPAHDGKTDGDLSLESNKKVIDSALNILCGRQKEIIQLYFGLNLVSPVPLEEIARKFELSIEHTRRLKDDALIRIRCSSHGGSLQSCFN